MDPYLIQIPGRERSPILQNLKDVVEILDKLKQKKWASRGHNRITGCINSKFDRIFNFNNSRDVLIQIEDEFSKNDTEIYLPKDFDELSEPNKGLNNDDEQFDLLKHRIHWLGKFQHYEGVTRLVDWSMDPYISAFFACYENTGNMGELWCFNTEKYNNYGPEQWNNYPDIKGTDDSYYRILKVVFEKQEPLAKFIVGIQNSRNFSRLKKQKGIFTLSPYFGTDHAKAINELFVGDTNCFQRYLISSNVIDELSEFLCKEKHICKKTVYPDDDIPFIHYAYEKTQEIKKKYQQYLINGNEHNNRPVLISKKKVNKKHFRKISTLI